MGTSKDGRVSKDFGDGQNKIKVRFNSERQARRVSFMLQYIRICIEDGASYQNADDVLAIKSLLDSDLDKAIEVMTKIQQKHKDVNSDAAAT